MAEDSRHRTELSIAGRPVAEDWGEEGEEGEEGKEGEGCRGSRLAASGAWLTGRVGGTFELLNL
jgi:hypothetical protein